MATVPATNSLGLDFDTPELLQTAEDVSTALADPPELPPTSPPSATKPETPQREKKKPYVNPDRVRTGGPQREKLTDEELKERMTRMREQNEKIKQRRLDVAADEAAFRQTQEAERQKMERTKKIQDTVDKTREQNVKRKMDKVQNREWDSGKPAAADWKNQPKKTPATQDTLASTPPLDSPRPTDAQASTPMTTDQMGSESRVRGSGSLRRGRGRGRGRSRGRVAPDERLDSSANASASNQNGEEQPREDEKATDSTNAA